MWIFAGEIGTAAALGVASSPAFLMLARAAGRRATILAVAAWPVAGVLVVLLGPKAVGGFPLWGATLRSFAVNVIAGAFVTPSFAGLLLVHIRLSQLSQDMASAVAESSAGALIVELARLRAAILRFLTTFAATITAGLLALGALRVAVLAAGAPAARVPPLRLLSYGGLLTGMAALIFVPAYIAWRERAAELRDALHPVPADGRPPHDWFQARDDLDGLLATRTSVAAILGTAFGVLAPLAASVVSTLLAAGR